jgi:hypothetical protein
MLFNTIVTLFYRIIMLGLNLRKEFQGSRLKGTTVHFDSNTGVLARTPNEFLEITYPSFDILKTIEAIQPQQSRPVVVLGERGQGKSHLLAAVYHICRENQAGIDWLNHWSEHLHDDTLRRFQLRSAPCIIAESLHEQRYKNLWDLIFDKHPEGQRIKGKWEAANTPVPSKDLLTEMFEKTPTVLIFDEFQTWFDGLSDSKQTPHKKRAFNFIQLLSEIAQNKPENLTLIVSIRDGQSDAAQQIRRVHPVLVDFKEQQSRTDRCKILLHRLFENRLHINTEHIRSIIEPHINEFFRIYQIQNIEKERYWQEFIEAYPFSPKLLRLLDDQVLVAIEAQETRDLIRILVDLFKNAANMPIITAGDFSLTNEKSGVASLLSSVANQELRKLRDVAMRNLEAVKATIPGGKDAWKAKLPHCEQIIGSLWLRSLTQGHNTGIEKNELQLDITRDKAIDDNAFYGELTAVQENSFNIHEITGRLLFKNEENPHAKLLAFARNDRQFENGEDINYLGLQIRKVLCDRFSQTDRLIVLKPDWRNEPWDELDETEHPHKWDNRQPYIVVPEFPDNCDKTMGQWLKSNMPLHINTVRFIFPRDEFSPFYNDKRLMIETRCVYLAEQWGAEYRSIKVKLEKELQDKIKGIFDRYAVLDKWNYQEPVKCQFHIEASSVRGDDILKDADDGIYENLFIPEDFADFVLLLAKEGESVGRLLRELQEPMSGEKPCIPWIGEARIKEKLIDLVADNKLALNINGTEYQSSPGETFAETRNRIKGRMGKGRELDTTFLHLPNPNLSSSGTGTELSAQANPLTTLPTDIVNPFSAITAVSSTLGQPVPSQPKPDTPKQHRQSVPTSGLNLLGQIEKWGVKRESTVTAISLKMEKMNGVQLNELLKNLPNGVQYTLELEQE